MGGTDWRMHDEFTGNVHVTVMAGCAARAGGRAPALPAASVLNAAWAAQREEEGGVVLAQHEHGRGQLGGVPAARVGQHAAEEEQERVQAGMRAVCDVCGVCGGCVSPYVRRHWGAQTACVRFTFEATAAAAAPAAAPAAAGSSAPGPAAPSPVAEASAGAVDSPPSAQDGPLLQRPVTDVAAV